MVRSQIVLDEPTARQLRIVSERSKASMSDVVRQALVFFFQHRKPDTDWVGSLRPAKKVSHDLKAIRRSVEAGRKGKAKR